MNETVHWVEYLKAASPFVLMIASVFIGTIAFFGRRMIKEFADALKQMRSHYDEALKGVNKEHDDLKEDFLRFQAKLPRSFVLKDDHIRHITIVERKIDELGATVQTGISALNSDVKLLLREIPARSRDA